MQGMHQLFRRTAGHWVLIIVFLLFFSLIPSFAQDSVRVVLAGAEGGLYRISIGQSSGKVDPLWQGGSVTSIVAAREGWYFIGSGGLIFSPDLASFENRSSGLPFKTVLAFNDGKFSLVREIETIKSLAVDPAKEGRLVLCTNTGVWYSEDGGRRWKDIGAPSTVPGTRAVSFGPWQGSASHLVWIAHSIKGLFVKDPENGQGWTSVSAGLPKAAGANGEEISSFTLVPKNTALPLSRLGQLDSKPNGAWTFYAALSFLGRLYEWNPDSRTFIERWNDGRDFESVESLGAAGSEGLMALIGSSPARFYLNPKSDSAASQSSGTKDSAGSSAANPIAAPVIDGELSEMLIEAGGLLEAFSGEKPSCIVLLPDLEPVFAGSGAALAPAWAPRISLSELWRFYDTAPILSAETAGLSDTARTRLQNTQAARERRRRADKKDGLYLQTGFVINKASREKYFALIQEKGLNSLVIDMKDDYGRLRFSPQSAILQELGVVGDRLDIEEFVAQAREKDIYLIARIVVFKDESLYKAKSGKFAVRDAGTGSGWRGTKKDGQLMGEYWVDPYSTDVWRYNVEIAQEVLRRGFDEVQFDYIRFPTDGENLDQARYPAQKPGMSPDSALESFLRFARQSIAAPISVDIYGANGWYRSGTRTGQDVEMLSRYADAVCPMLYPSHFEQNFMAQAPTELRPYRIYKIGSLRNLALSRGQMLVRPYVQAFYLDVSYDRSYYGPRYVELEIEGVREGADQGMTFWNNSGRYTDLPVLGKP